MMMTMMMTMMMAVKTGGLSNIPEKMQDQMTNQTHIAFLWIDWHAEYHQGHH